MENPTDDLPEQNNDNDMPDGIKSSQLSNEDENHERKNSDDEYGDPESRIHYTPDYLVYRSMRLKSHGKFTFQFTLDEDHLFITKMKGKHPTIPIPIGNGAEIPKSTDTEYVLIPSKDFHQFSMTQNGEEVFSCELEPVDPNRKSPKKITAHWIPKTGQQYHLKSRMPELQPDGEYVLDFQERFAKPSIKNAIFADVETDQIYIMLRRLDEWEMNCEARPEIPPILVFALLLSINICPF